MTLLDYLLAANWLAFGAIMLGAALAAKIHRDWLHVASYDDLAKPGLTFIVDEWRVGIGHPTRRRLIALRLVIDVALPATREFLLDYGHYVCRCRVNWWLRAEIGRARALCGIYCGIHAGRELEKPRRTRRDDGATLRAGREIPFLDDADEENDLSGTEEVLALDRRARERRR